MEEDTVQGGARIIFLAGKCASNPLKNYIHYWLNMYVLHDFYL